MLAARARSLLRDALETCALASPPAASAGGGGGEGRRGGVRSVVCVVDAAVEELCRWTDCTEAVFYGAGEEDGGEGEPCGMLFSLWDTPVATMCDRLLCADKDIRTLCFFVAEPLLTAGEERRGGDDELLAAAASAAATHVGDPGQPRREAGVAADNEATERHPQRQHQLIEQEEKKDRTAGDMSSSTVRARILELLRRLGQAKVTAVEQVVIYSCHEDHRLPGHMMSVHDAMHDAIVSVWPQPLDRVRVQHLPIAFLPLMDAPHDLEVEADGTASNLELPLLTLAGSERNRQEQPGLSDPPDAPAAGGGDCSSSNSDGDHINLLHTLTGRDGLGGRTTAELTAEDVARSIVEGIESDLHMDVTDAVYAMGSRAWDIGTAMVSRIAARKQARRRARRREEGDEPVMAAGAQGTTAVRTTGGDGSGRDETAANADLHWAQQDEQEQEREQEDEEDEEEEESDSDDGLREHQQASIVLVDRELDFASPVTLHQPEGDDLSIRILRLLDECHGGQNQFVPSDSLAAFVPQLAPDGGSEAQQKGSDSLDADPPVAAVGTAGRDAKPPRADAIEQRVQFERTQVEAVNQAVSRAGLEGVSAGSTNATLQMIDMLTRSSKMGTGVRSMRSAATVPTLVPLVMDLVARLTSVTDEALQAHDQLFLRDSLVNHLVQTPVPSRLLVAQERLTLLAARASSHARQMRDWWRLIDILGAPLVGDLLLYQQRAETLRRRQQQKQKKKKKSLLRQTGPESESNNNGEDEKEQEALEHAEAQLRLRVRDKLDVCFEHIQALAQRRKGFAPYLRLLIQRQHEQQQHEQGQQHQDADSSFGLNALHDGTFQPFVCLLLHVLFTESCIRAGGRPRAALPEGMELVGSSLQQIGKAGLGLLESGMSKLGLGGFQSSFGSMAVSLTTSLASAAAMTPPHPFDRRVVILFVVGGITALELDRLADVIRACALRLRTSALGAEPVRLPRFILCSDVCVVGCVEPK